MLEMQNKSVSATIGDHTALEISITVKMNVINV